MVNFVLCYSRQNYLQFGTIYANIAISGGYYHRMTGLNLARWRNMHNNGSKLDSWKIASENNKTYD